MNVIIFEEASPRWLRSKNKKKKEKEEEDSFVNVSSEEKKKDNTAGYFQRIPLW